MAADMGGTASLRHWQPKNLPACWWAVFLGGIDEVERLHLGLAFILN